MEALVPKDHLLWKIERIMDCEWLYGRLSPFYCHDNGRNRADPVVLAKMVLLQHLYGTASHPCDKPTSGFWTQTPTAGFRAMPAERHLPLRHSKHAFCKRFPPELASEIFEHILNKVLNNRVVYPSMIFIDSTHIKASANKKKFQKAQVAKAAKIYSDKLHREVNTERGALSKKPIEEDDEDEPPQAGGTVEKSGSTTDPESGMFVKGEHERQFAMRPIPLF